MIIRQLTQRAPQLECIGKLCDICGHEIKTIRSEDDVEIHCAIGNVWPEGDCRESTWIDCCVECFTTKVKPALEAIGAKFQSGDTEDRWNVGEVLPGVRGA
jgi:hypothetical protein